MVSPFRTGALFGESYTVMPLFGRVRTLRQVLAPMLAYDALRGSGKGLRWLLVGDADTIFAPLKVLSFLNELGLSADEPHMLSDFLVDCALSKNNSNCQPGRFCGHCTSPIRGKDWCMNGIGVESCPS